MPEQPAGLTPAPANPQPWSAGPQLQPTFDLIEVLPKKAAERLQAMRDHVRDRHAMIEPFSEIAEASAAKVEADTALSRLLAPAQSWGFHLHPDDPRAKEQRKRAEKLAEDFKRLTERNEVKTAAWQEASAALSAVEGWIRSGRPGNATLEDFEVGAKLNKGETAIAGLDRLRRRVRELKADLHRIESSCYPSAYCKKRLREMVGDLASKGTPSVSRLLELDQGIDWQTQQLQSSIYNTGTPAIAFAEVPDLLGLVCCLHREAICTALDALVDTEKDDAASLSHEARQTAAAQVMQDLLAVERDEAALVSALLAEGQPVFYRRDCSPLAILQVRLITAPRADVPSTSVEHAWDVVGGRRR